MNNKITAMPVVTPVDPDLLTLDQFQAALPKQVKKHVNQVIIDDVNKILQDPDFRETYRENLLSYTSVMNEGRFKMKTYIDAVKYVSYKLLGASNMVAWCKSFPVRYQELLNRKMEAKHIASIVSAYNKGVLVNKIFAQTLVPSHVLNADLHQKAINQLAYLMMNAKSEKVQSDSAAKLVDALKLPETQKIELDMTLKEDNTIGELRESTLELVRMQKAMIETGAMTPKEVAHSKLVKTDVTIVEGELVE